MPSSLASGNRLFYGWVVVITFFIICTTLYGVYFSFGIFFKSIESEFNLTRAATSAILSANVLLGGIFAFFAGWLLDKFGPRSVVLLMGLFSGLSLLLTSQTNALGQLFLTYGLLLAMGTGAIFVVPTSTIARWFNKKRGLALGIASSGIGLGPAFIAPFATYLIARFDWRLAYLIIGLITWVIVLPLSRLLKGDPQEIGARPDGAKAKVTGDVKDSIISLPSLSLHQALRTRSFWLVLFTWVLYAFNVFLVTTHLVPHATDIGFSAGEAATIVSVLGGGAIAGRVLMGIASDRIGRRLTPIVCTLLLAGAMLWLVGSQELWRLYLFAAIFGFGYSGVSSSMGALLGDTFGLGKIGSILGLLEIGLGTGAAIGPVVGGLIFDINQSYVLAFFIGTALMLVATLLITFIRRETSQNLESG